MDFRFAVPIFQDGAKVFTTAMCGTMTVTPFGMDVVSTEVVTMDAQGHVVRSKREIPCYLPKPRPAILAELHDGNVEPAVEEALEGLRERFDPGTFTEPHLQTLKRLGYGDRLHAGGVYVKHLA